MHNINPIDSDSIDSSAPPQIMMAAAPVEDYPPVNEDLNPNVNNYPVKAATIKDEVYAKPSEEYPPEKPSYDDKKNEALLPELKVDGKKVQPKSEFEIIRNICITRGIQAIIISIALSLTNSFFTPSTQSLGLILLIVSISIFVILGIFLNVKEESLFSDSIRIQSIILYLVLTISLTMFCLGIDFMRSGKGDLFFYLFLNIYVSSIATMDVISVFYIHFAKDNYSGKINFVLTFAASIVECIIAGIIAGNWLKMCFIYLAVVITMIFYCATIAFIKQNMRDEFNCSFYGASKTFTHIFRGVVTFVLLIFVGPILICGGDSLKNGIKKKLLGNYNPFKV